MSVEMRSIPISYIIVDQYMVDGVLITNHKLEYLARSNKMDKDMGLVHRGCFSIDGKKIYFNENTDDLY